MQPLSLFILSRPSVFSYQTSREQILTKSSRKTGGQGPRGVIYYIQVGCENSDLTICDSVVNEQWRRQNFSAAGAQPGHQNFD